MLNQTNQKIKLFEHQLNHQTTTSNTKPPYPEDESSYLALLYPTCYVFCVIKIIQH
ncbi:hypothetical protein [Rickettsia tamurae]|uniref:Uncharacterized protein n=1 Tax=Rickettsia tamurae subsp. buchneri TaxID=1462938 RepID=A0A8E0WKC7_9RICK|nr:hypothetical protein [Rickettsia tamurae]KDO02140.1 hypothetical protein REISMN_08785 [Rickettsia tamurae subsp. buchneri]